MNQLPLPFKNLNVPARHVEWLRVANAGNYLEKKFWFYPFKTRFLRTHALPDGFDLQIITLKCWCGDGIFRGMDYDRPERFWEPCAKCSGTGIYLKKRIPLIRWWLNGHLFHEPSQLVAGGSGMEYHTTFDGFITHPAPAGGDNAARRAMERLFLRYEPGRFYDLWLARWRGLRPATRRKVTHQVNQTHGRAIYDCC